MPVNWTSEPGSLTDARTRFALRWVGACTACGREWTARDSLDDRAAAIASIMAHHCANPQ